MGDVAGERGDGPLDLRGVGAWRLPLRWWAHPRIELVAHDGPAPGSWTGVAAAAGAWRETLSAFEALRTVADEYRVLDDERVLVLMHFSGRGKTSGLEVGEIHTKGANLFQLEGGKVTRLVLWWDRDRALSDLGLNHEE